MVCRTREGPSVSPTAVPCQSSCASRNLPDQVSTTEPAHLEPTSTTTATTASPHCPKMPVLGPDQVSEPPTVNLIQAWRSQTLPLASSCFSSCKAQSRRSLSHLLSPSSSAQCCLPFFLLLANLFFIPSCTQKAVDLSKADCFHPILGLFILLFHVVVVAAQPDDTLIHTAAPLNGEQHSPHGHLIACVHICQRAPHRPKAQEASKRRIRVVNPSSAWYTHSPPAGSVVTSNPLLYIPTSYGIGSPSIASWCARTAARGSLRPDQWCRPC